MGAGVAAQPDRPSGNSPPSAGESVVNKNLTWILGTVAVLYMIVKVFVVSHGDPNVARAVAISAGVTSLIAGIMVGGLPNLACILLLASIAWAMMDIIRMRMPSQASLVSILIFFAISILTAPRSQFGLTALVSLNLLFIVLTFRQPSTITDSRRHLAIGGVILGTVVFTFTLSATFASTGCYDRSGAGNIHHHWQHTSWRSIY
jgi:hypothetical protein